MMMRLKMLTLRRNQSYPLVYQSKASRKSSRQVFYDIQMDSLRLYLYNEKYYYNILIIMNSRVLLLVLLEYIAWQKEILKGTRVHLICHFWSHDYPWKCKMCDCTKMYVSESSLRFCHTPVIYLWCRKHMSCCLVLLNLTNLLNLFLSLFYPSGIHWIQSCCRWTFT